MPENADSDRLTRLFENLAADLRIAQGSHRTAPSLMDLVRESTGVPTAATGGSGGVSTNSSSAGTPAETGSSARSQGLDLLGSLLGTSPISVLPTALGATTTKDDRDSSTVWKVLTGGFGLISAVTAIARLFGGGDGEPLPELVRYEAPPKLRLEAAGRLAGPDNVALSGLTYNERGLPREAFSSGRDQQNITVQIQALDSRSFLDHSHDIARAVREAMLHMDPLNDIVNDI
jgi:hypothetical protein